jgi:hypothetical protein
MLGRKSKSKFSRLVVIGMVSSVCMLGIASSSNSQTNSIPQPKAIYNSCGAIRSWIKADCTHHYGQNPNQPGIRILEIQRITDNGGNVYVRVYDADSNRTLLEANPGVGGKEEFFFGNSGTNGYYVQTRLHNPGSAVDYKITRK